MATNSKLKERRVASIAAFSKDGLLLFGRRADNKKWTLPGGHLEANETPMDGAKRELLEEAGLEGSDYEYLGNGTVTEGLTIFSYRCVVDGEPTAEDDPDAEMMSWRWVEPDSIPDEIMENLHSPKNITLRLLGLQDGEVGGLVKSDIQAQKPIAVKHYSPVAGLTRLDPKFQGTAAAGQERNRTKRIPRTYYYLRHAAPETHVSSGGNLYHGELPAGTKLYDMSADHLQLLKPKMQQTNAGMVFRPVDFDQVEKKLAKLGYHGYHSYGPQGALAYFHPLAVRPGVERNLKKGLGGLALAGAVALGLGGGPTPQQTSNKVVQAPQLPQWTPEGLHPDMYPIAHLESSWGKNVAHSVNKKGDFHTAFGALGFKPVTAHEEYLKSPFMQKTYPGHSSPDKFLQKFKQDPKFYNLLASAHFARLTAKHGGPAQASYAWRWGSGAAHKASPEQIKNDLYVQKYTASNLHQKQSLQKAEPTGKDWTAIASETVKRAKASEPKIRKEAERQGLHPFLHQPDKYHQTPPSWDTGWCHAASKAFQKEHPEVELHDFVEPDFERFNEWGSVAHVAPYIPSIGKYMDFNHGLVDAQHLANRFFSLDDKENRIEPHDVDRAAFQLYTAAPGKNSQLTDIIHEHLFGDNTAIQKSEDLIKMAVGTIKPGAPITPSIRMRHSADGYRLDTHKVFDYSHHLTPEQQNAGYALHVYDGVNNSDGTKTINVHLHRPNFLDSSVGDLAGEIFGKDLGVTYSQVKEQHRRQGLGQKMYEAAYAHAFHHHGVNSVSGTDHSSMAAKVHRKLNETHGFKYKPESVSRWQTRKPEGPFDSKYYGYKYSIKSELAKSEEDPLAKAEDLDKGIHGDWSKELGYRFQINSTRNPDYHLLKVYHGRKRIGALAYSQHSHSIRNLDGKWHDVVQGQIAPEHQGKGLYQEMLRRADEHVKSLGSTGIKSEGWQQSSMSNRVWNKVGKENNPDPKLIGRGTYTFGKNDDLAKGEFRSAAFRHKDGTVAETGVFHNIEPWLQGGSMSHRPDGPYNSSDWEAGFVTNDGAFMNRDEAAKHVGLQRYSPVTGQLRNLDSQDPEAFGKSEEDPLESMLHHDDPRERVLALKSKSCTPHHLRLALQDEDPDVRAAAVLHPMMTGPLLEEALRHPDLHTRQTALSRHDLQEHHLEQALWDPELQAQAAMHPCLTEEQRQKVLTANDTPSGLRNELLAKSVGFLTYPKLGQPTIATKPMVREPEAHHRMAIASGAQTITNGYIHYPRLRTPLPPGGAWMSSSMKGGMPPNAHLATEGHESQHSVFAALRQRYGDDAGHRIVATTLAALDPTEHQHLRNITDWKVKFRYSPAREAEERIAHLHNYLLDPGFRNTSHKAMKIFHDPEAQQAAHTKAKGIFQKLRLAAQTLTPQSVGLIPTGVFQKSLIKSWVQDKTKVDGYSVHEDMLGLNHKSDTYLSAAKFLANLDPDEGVFRRCLLADTDMTEAALTSVGLEVTDKSRKALEAILRLQSSDLSKSSNQVEVLALMPESEQVAASVLRGFQADKAKDIQLNGKHSAGAMKVDDPESNQVYLLKPGSGRQNSAAGVQEEPASQSRREAAFWAVADLCGLGNRIPRTDLLLINGREVATLHMLPMEWMNLERLKVKDSGLPHKALEKYRQSGELHKWAILDYVLGNADRHGSNIMVGEQKDGYPVALIDHGSAFAGLDFDPANDKNSFVPYYLRAWKAEGWGSLDFEQKLRSMPVVSGDVEAQLRSWLEGLHADAIEQVLHRYGIDPSASLTRLAKIKALLSTPNLSEAVNRLWLAA